MSIYPPPDMKMEWPEVKGMEVEAARELILKECPDVRIQVLGEFQPATMDYRLDRVRIIKSNTEHVICARRG